MTGQFSHRRDPCSNCRCSVVDTLRLADGTLFPIPVTLDVSQEDIDLLSLAKGKRVALRDPRDDQALAIITSKGMSASSLHSSHLTFL
jgi:ATP sulfurylase